MSLNGARWLPDGAPEIAGDVLLVAVRLVMRTALYCSAAVIPSGSLVGRGHSNPV